eukprot:3173862-Rhodomonas_salina.2
MGYTGWLSACCYSTAKSKTRTPISVLFVPKLSLISQRALACTRVLCEVWYWARVRWRLPTSLLDGVRY